MAPDDQSAFPTVSREPYGGEIQSLGMSLRDYFAAKSLTDKEFNAVLASLSAAHPKRESFSLAEIRYHHADAMLAERSKSS